MIWSKTSWLFKCINILLVVSLLVGTGILEPVMVLAVQSEKNVIEEIEGGIEEDEVISDNNEGKVDEMIQGEKPILSEDIIEGNKTENNGLLDISTITSNNSPIINVDLKSESIVSALPGDEIEVSYEINPQDFKANLDSSDEVRNSIEEAVFIIDTSNNVSENGFKNVVVNALTNQITNNSVIQANEFKLSIIGYNDTIVYPNNDASKVRLYNVANEQEAFRLLAQGDKALSRESQKSGRNMTEALKKSDELLSNGNNVGKAIVLIGTDNISVDQSIINLIKSKGYTIISFLLPTFETIDEHAYNMETLYTLLGGEVEGENKLKNHFVASYEAGNYNKADDDMGKVREALLSKRAVSIKKEYKVNATLNFDLGTNFLHVSGLSAIGQTMYRLDVPVTYVPTIQNEDGTYTYSADNQEVKFKIKVNTTNTGTVTFNNPESSDSNYFTYKDFSGNTLSNTNIETPSVYIGTTYTNDSIKILEIEPADYFQLGSKKGLTTGTEELNINGEKVEVTRITMPEFIGSVEKLNGKYDVIVLGRYVHDFSKNNSKNQQKYKDYSLTRDEDKEENDITNRKAEEIIQFINSGQLVYIDKNIFDTKISDTKLYRNFENVSGTNLVTTNSVSELSIDSIVKHYKNNVLAQQKQLTLQVTDATASDIATSDLNTADGIAANRTRKMIISANTLKNVIDSSQISENVSIKLYLDLDGDGLFSDDEIATTRENIKTPFNRLVLDYNIHPDFLGLLSWKLEITKGDSENPIKTYLTGDMNFHRLPDRPKKQINVLHLIPQPTFNDADEYGNLDENNKQYEILDLSKNKTFNNLLKNEVALKDYKIDVTTISVSNYNQIMDKTSSLTDFETGVKELNGYYDMLILGFGDCYTGCGSTFGINNSGVNNIYEFVKTGQGLMLTHDTLFYQRDTNIESSKNSIVNLFRGISGQARYGLGNSSVYTSLKDLDGSDIPFDTDKPLLSNLSKYSGAASVWQDTPNMGRESLSSYVYETNNALITEYPFDLITTGDTLRVRGTHAQYLQLNLEDEAVIPWYTLSGSLDSRMNPYDVRNNYYTYSRNNITFSGTGENKRENAPYPDLEMKLFINTIVKAERGANHAPTLELVNISESTVVSKQQGNFSFNVIPYDMDLDKMKLSIEVFGCKNNSCSDKSILEQKDSDFIRVNGVSVDVNFDIKNKLTDFDQIKIKVVATDEHNASSQATEVLISLTNQYLLDVSFIADKVGYLIGDEVSVTTSIKSNGDAANNGNFYLLTPISSLISLQSSGVGTTSFNFDIRINETMNRTFQFKVNNHTDIQTDNNKALNVAAKYSYCLEINSQSCVKLPETPDIKTAVLNVKRGQIIVEFSSNVANLFTEHEVAVQLLDGNSNILKTQQVTNSNNVIFDAVPSGNYFIKIIKPNTILDTDYTLQMVGDSSTSMSWNKEYPVSVFYNENVKTLRYELNEVRFNLEHGLFKSQSDTQIIIEPSTYQNPKQVKGHTLVNFAATYTTRQSSSNAILTVSNKVDIDSIKVYKLEIDEISDKLSIRPFVNVEVINEGQDYHIILPENTEAGGKVLIYYTGLVQNENISYLTNKMSVGATTMDVVIRVNREAIVDPEENAYLPNLF